jgi:hypothetical protein
MVGDKEIRGVEEIHEMIVSRTSTLWMQGSPPPSWYLHDFTGWPSKIVPHVQQASFSIDDVNVN